MHTTRNENLTQKQFLFVKLFSPVAGSCLWSRTCRSGRRCGSSSLSTPPSLGPPSAAPSSRWSCEDVKIRAIVKFRAVPIIQNQESEIEILSSCSWYEKLWIGKQILFKFRFQFKLKWLKTAEEWKSWFFRNWNWHSSSWDEISVPVCHALDVPEPLGLELRVGEELRDDPAAVDGRRRVHPPHQDLHLRGHARALSLVLEWQQVYCFF